MDRPIAYMGDQPYIFVSYSHKDCERVWPIILKLQAEGFRIWYDDGISPGTEWDLNIATHIRKCDFFAAFISRNYLESENCKDELSFVRELGKNRVLIYLEEVVLPDELQMRLGRLQAIYWNRDGEKKAYKKFMQSPGVNVCKEPVMPVEPPHEEPAAPPSVAETPAHEPEKAAPVKTVAPAKSTTPVKASAPKKSPILFICIGAALLLGAIFALKSIGSKHTNDVLTSAQEVKEENPSEEDVSQDSNAEDATASSNDSAIEESTESDYLAKALTAYSNGVVSSQEGTMFAGILCAHNPSSSAFKSQQDLDYNGDTYTVSRLPFMTISSYDDQNSIILGFIDKFGADFYFYGTHTVENGVLTVSPGGSAGTFEQACAPLTESLTFSIDIGSYYIKLSKPNDTTYVDLLGSADEEGNLILKGALSEGSSPYEGLLSLDLVLGIENDELKKGVLSLEDDMTANVGSFTHWPSIRSLSLKWSSVDYILNGRPVTEDVNGYANFTYINQYPAGFMILESDKTIHFYQDLSGF